MSQNYTLNTKMPWARTRSDLETCFKRWGIRDWNIIEEKDGRTVTVRYTHPGGKEVRLSMSREWRRDSNLRILYLGLEAMRMNEARGLAEMMGDAYLQLAAPTAARDPYEVLGVRPDTDMDTVEDMYRIKAKRLHPDTGSGDVAAMTELNAAMERIRAERAVPA